MRVSGTCPPNRSWGWRGWREREMEGRQKRNREEAIKKFLLSWTNGLFRCGSLPRLGDNGADTYYTSKLFFTLPPFIHFFFLNFPFSLPSYLHVQRELCKRTLLIPLLQSFFFLHLPPPPPLPLSIPHSFPERLVHRHLPAELNPLSVYSTWMIALLTWLHGTHTKHTHAPLPDPGSDLHILYKTGV